MGSSESTPPPAFEKLWRTISRRTGSLASRERAPSERSLTSPPTFERPWRTVAWNNREEDLKYIKDFQLEDQVKPLRILLYGPVGAGKSTFINSVSCVLRGRLAPLTATSAATSGDSFTRKYETHKIRKGRASEKSFYPFVFSDIKGLEQKGNSGSVVEDLKLIMQGRMKDGYEFNTTPLREGNKYYNKDPSPGDRVHVVVCVLSANTAEIEASVVQKMKKVRGIARDLGVPEIVIVTKIDEACDVTEDDLKDVYLSKHLKKKMEDFSSSVGFPVNCMFPVKNYSSEIEMNEDTDVLILGALKHMLNFGGDFIDKITA